MDILPKKVSNYSILERGRHDWLIFYAGDIPRHADGAMVTNAKRIVIYEWCLRHRQTAPTAGGLVFIYASSGMDFGVGRLTIAQVTYQCHYDEDGCGWTRLNVGIQIWRAAQ